MALTHPDWNHPNMDFLLDPRIDVTKPDPAFFITVYDLIDPNVYREACHIFSKDFVDQWIRDGRLLNNDALKYSEYIQYKQCKFSGLDNAEKRREMYLQYFREVIICKNNNSIYAPTKKVHPYFTIAEIEFNVDRVHKQTKATK
jgi:hypothetical protein